MLFSVHDSYAIFELIIGAKMKLINSAENSAYD